MADTTFFFDPSCPWTWRASRWLTLVAETRGLAVEWRPMSLLVLNGDDVSPERRPGLEASHRLLRVVEQLGGDGRQADIARLYGAVGELVHDHDAALDGPLLAHALQATGLADLRPVLDDAGLDPAVEASTAAGLAAAGPGVGSPVLVLAGTDRGLHGPVLRTVPDKATSLALWDALETLIPIGEFFEVKRGRS